MWFIGLLYWIRLVLNFQLTSFQLSRHPLTCWMFLEIHVSSKSSSLCPWYLQVVFTAMNRSDGVRRSTGPGVTFRLGTVIALLSRVSFLKYAEKTFPPVAAAAECTTGSPLLGCATVATSMPVTSRQVTAVAAARGPAAELKVLIDPPAGFHIATEVLQLQSWTEEMELSPGVYNIIDKLDPTHSWSSFVSFMSAWDPPLSDTVNL